MNLGKKAKSGISRIWALQLLHKPPDCAIKQAEYEEGGQINEVLAESLNR
jgi:hypothetical protein